MRDIDTTVSFMRDLLKHEANTRSNTSSPSYGASTPVGAGGGSKDATAYKHDDTRPSGYKPSSRHLDRKSVRYAGEDSNADISDIRRQLANTSAMLDKSNDDYMRKTEEDEQLEQDVDDLKYRVKRIQDDIEYLTKGRRSADKDEERRKLEREMLFLMHEKLPELERRQKQREEDKRMEERAGTRARDRRNDSHGKYRDDRDRDDDRDWLRGSYDRDRRRDSRDRDRSRDRYDNDRSRDRSRDRYERPRSPPRSRTPPPAPPPAPAASAVANPPPAPPAPTSNATAAPSTKNMTPEERSAFIREQAQRRIQERLKALGVESGSSSTSETPAVDKSVEERLEREKREAEEKSKSAEKEQEAREEARRQRLQGGGAKPADEEKPPTGSTPSPAAPLRSAMKKAPAAPPAPPASRAKAAPPAPKPRQPAPSPAPPVAPAAPPAEEEDPEEAELRRKEEARAKAKEDRRARLAALEAEEEEERKQEEARLAARQAKSTPVASPAPPTPTPKSPPPASSAGGGAGGDHNPFRKPGHPTAAAAATSGGGGFNPFFKPQSRTASPAPAATASPASGVTSPPPPPPPPPPAPPVVAPVARASATSTAADDEWERIEEKTDDSDADSSDDDYAHSRTKRAGLASALFGNITGGPARSGSSTPTAPPAPKAPPPAALAKLGGGTPTSGGGMSALLSSIQGGARLKKAQTVDKSGPGVSGRVIGGADVPAHITAAEPPAANGQGPPEEEVEDEVVDRNPNRQSVDWLGGLAADHSRGSVSAGSERADYQPLEATQEESEPVNGTSTPAINVQPAESGGGDELDEFDLTQSKRRFTTAICEALADLIALRVRTLFAYDGQRDVDLSFIENVVIEAHPAKDSQSPWWYGTLVKEGKKGWFPHTYVEELKRESRSCVMSPTGYMSSIHYSSSLLCGILIADMLSGPGQSVLHLRRRIRG